MQEKGAAQNAANYTESMYVAMFVIISDYMCNLN